MSIMNQKIKPRIGDVLLYVIRGHLIRGNTDFCY
jgi:hypothetical protein